jgi:hypothetical protein
MADTTEHHGKLHQFLATAPASDWLMVNGDYSCDSGFIGVSEEAAGESAAECLGKLRARAGARFAATMGDHELGKVALGSGLGGMRLASYERATNGLGLQPFWEIRLGRYVLLGVTSSLIALPAYEREALAAEIPGWRQLREQQMAAIRTAFNRLEPSARVILFCHDPTALPFLGREEAVAPKLGQIEKTIIGHLHTPAVFAMSRLLSGMPVINFLGHVPRRLSTSLRRAREWRPFNVALCPSVAGCQLFKDGGYLTLALDPEGRQPLQLQRHRLAWG